MANNRMLIVHKTTLRAMVIAKYYPSNGWAVSTTKLEAFLDKFEPDDWMKGDDFVLMYESDDRLRYASHDPLMVALDVTDKA